MATDPVPLAYASPEPLGVAFKPIRWMFAWFALGFGFAHALRDALVAYGVWRSLSIVWPQLISPVATLPMYLVLIVGGGLALRDRGAGTLVVRIAALSICIAEAMAGIGWQMYYAANSGSRLYPRVDFAQGVLLAVLDSAFSTTALLFCLSFPLRRLR